MRLKLTDLGTISCPHCKYDCDMHPRKIEVFMREEDTDRGQYAAVDFEKTETRGVIPPGNPSGRRQGVLVHFHCLYCGNPSRLGIAQHKGQTYCEWQGLA